MNERTPDEDFDRDANAQRSLRTLGETTSAGHDAAVRRHARRIGQELHTRQQPARRPWRRPALTIATALAAGLLAAVVFWRVEPDTQADDRFRGASSDPVATALIPPAQATLRQAPRRFAWPTQPGPNNYQLQLRNADGTLLWRSAPRSENRIDLATESDPPLLEAGKTYLWSVEVDGERGHTELGPYWFRIRD